MNRFKSKNVKQKKNEPSEQSVTNKTQEIDDSMNKMKEIQRVCDNTPDFDSFFEKHRLPCMTIDVNENLSKTPQSIKCQIVLKETKERTRIENPKLYDFVYNNDSIDNASITIPSHLNFAEIPSYIENVQYHTLQTVKHCFEQDKMQLQNIPWKEVPIPPPQMNVKIIGENRNQQ